MKLYILSPNQITRWNRGHQLLRNSIAEHSGLEVKQIGPGFDNMTDNGPFNVYDLFQLYGGIPDVVMTYGLKYSLQFHGMSNLKTTKLHVCCDLTPPNEAGYKALLARDNYDIFVAHTGRVVDWLERYGYGKEGDNIFFWPFGVDTNIYKPKGEERGIDVMTSWSVDAYAYPERAGIDNIVRHELSQVYAVQVDKVYGGSFVNALASSKIVLNTTSRYRIFNMKILEVMACGALLLTQDWDDRSKRMFDFQDEFNIVIWTGMNDLLDKIDYYLANDNKRETIAMAGLETVKCGHTNECRAKSFGEMLKSWI